MKGDFEEGMALIDRGEELFAATGARVYGFFYPALEADLWLRAGNVEKGLQAVQRGYDSMIGSDVRYFHSEVQRCEAELRALAGASDDEVERLFDTAIATSEAQHAKSLTLRTMTSFAAWLTRKGRSEEASSPPPRKRPGARG